MKAKTWAAMTLAMIATPVILVMLARNDLGEDSVLWHARDSGHRARA